VSAVSWNAGRPSTCTMCCGTMSFPPSILRSVVLPAPFAPISSALSPACSSKFIPLMSGFAPGGGCPLMSGYVYARSVTLMSGPAGSPASFMGAGADATCCCVFVSGLEMATTADGGGGGAADPRLANSPALDESTGATACEACDTEPRECVTETGTGIAIQD